MWKNRWTQINRGKSPIPPPSAWVIALCTSSFLDAPTDSSKKERQLRNASTLADRESASCSGGLVCAFARRLP